MRTIVTTALIMIAAPAAAQADAYGQAINLGEILGKAEACGLTVNEDAVVAYMRDRDLLTVDLTAVVDRGRQYEAGRDMTAVGCAAVRAAAEETGLTG